MQLLHLRTKQDVFDYVLRAIRKQGTPAMEAKACRYLTRTGSRCAIGHLIPSWQYRPDMEGSSPKELVIKHEVDFPFSQNSEEWYEFLNDLQRAHDDAALSQDIRMDRVDNTLSFMILFEEDMKKLANTWHLTYTPPKGE